MKIITPVAQSKTRLSREPTKDLEIWSDIEIYFLDGVFDPKMKNSSSFSNFFGLDFLVHCRLNFLDLLMFFEPKMKN